MSDQANTQRTGDFYERFHFPGTRPVDRDGLIFLRRFTTSIAQLSSAGSVRALRVIDAGCGTGNTSVALARRFPDVTFEGLDQSEGSLAEARALAARHAVTNLRVQRWNILHPFPFDEPFDIALCLGVLHHTADMAACLANLHSALLDDGLLYLWIYGRHGRFLHALNMRLLALLLRDTPAIADRIALAAQFARTARGGAMLRDLAGSGQAELLHSAVSDDPVWIADQFLNPHETLLNLPETLAMARGAGFLLEQVLGLDADVAGCLAVPELYERYQTLDREDQLEALDLLLKPERYFLVLRRTRRGE
jgi:SAM-dependent methyltransferase